MNETTEVKSGVKTSEFYMPTVTAALGLLVALGLLTTELADSVAGAIAAAVPAVVGLIGAVLAAVEYIKSRTAVKEAAIAAETEVLKENLKAPPGAA